ncbi:hypothetical protein V5799_010090, partial [Amblyomma americanum]
LRFSGVVCDDCGQNGIVGTRWKCDVCRDFDLCTDCYKSSEHSQEHAFWRIDIPEATGFYVPPRQRSTSSRRRHTSHREERVLQESRRVNQAEMFPVRSTELHRRSSFDEEAAHGEGWIFQDEALAEIGGIHRGLVFVCSSKALLSCGSGVVVGSAVIPACASPSGGATCFSRLHLSEEAKIRRRCIKAIVVGSLRKRPMNRSCLSVL